MYPYPNQHQRPFGSNPIQSNPYPNQLFGSNGMAGHPHYPPNRPYWNLGWLNPFNQHQNPLAGAGWLSGRESPGGVMANPHINVPLVPGLAGLMKTGSNGTMSAKNNTDSDYYDQLQTSRLTNWYNLKIYVIKMSAYNCRLSTRYEIMLVVCEPPWHSVLMLTTRVQLKIVLFW